MTSICKICKVDNDKIGDHDLLERLGELMHGKKYTVHYFCMLLSAKLHWRKGKAARIANFIEADVGKDIIQTKTITCCYCNDFGANINCCYKDCKNSFHLPCAVKQHCLFEFCDSYRSFCYEHSLIEIKNTDGFVNKEHPSNEACCICKEEMNDYHPIESFQLPRCNKDLSNASRQSRERIDWCHKICMIRYAASSANYFKCPIGCNNIEYFKKVVVRRGIFIPQRDAAWELDPSYNLSSTEQPTMRPNSGAFSDTRFLQLNVILPDIRSRIKRLNNAGDDTDDDTDDLIQPGQLCRLNKDGDLCF